jgi:hypothetical protein
MSKQSLIIEDDDEIISCENGTTTEPFQKVDIYKTPEYLSALEDAKKYEESEQALHYKNLFCLQECGGLKVLDKTIENHYSRISPYITNSLEEVKGKRTKGLCVLQKGHTGKCSCTPNIFIKNNVTEKLKGSISLCIYSTPGNDDYVYKNRAPRSHPIALPRSIEKKIRQKTTKLSCAIPLSEYSTPFMQATAYIDWLTYIISICDINKCIDPKLKNENKEFKNIIETRHKEFIKNHYEKFNRNLFNKLGNTVCAVKQSNVLTEHVSDPDRDNRTDINPYDIQMGHIKSRNDNYFSVRGLNIVMMSRDGNRIIGEYSYIENEWIDELKKIISHY